MLRRTACAAALALSAQLAVSTPASAADAVADARAEYDAAAAAYDRRDYVTAATRFARADELVPNPRTLQLAMAAALLAPDVPLAMSLADRSDARPRSPAASELARKIRTKLADSAGRLRFACSAPEKCRAVVDGERVDASQARWVSPGQHRVELEEGALRIEREVAVGGGEQIEVTLEDAGARSEPSETSAPERARSLRFGISPVVFWSGVGLTTAAAVAATYFTVVTADRHDAFIARPSVETSRDGEAAQLHARVAWGVTGALAVTTAALCVFTDFGAARVGIGPGALVVAGSFR